MVFQGGYRLQLGFEGSETCYTREVVIFFHYMKLLALVLIIGASAIHPSVSHERNSRFPANGW